MSELQLEEAGVRLASLADATLTLDRAGGLKRGAHHASFGAEGGAVDDGALGAGDEGYDCRHFLGLLEALQERTGANPYQRILFPLTQQSRPTVGQAIPHPASFVGHLLPSGEGG